MSLLPPLPTVVHLSRAAGRGAKVGKVERGGWRLVFSLLRMREIICMGRLNLYHINTSVKKDIVKETVMIVVVPLSSPRFLVTIQSNWRNFSRRVASKVGISSEVRMVISYTRNPEMTWGHGATGIYCHFDLFHFREKWVRQAERWYDDLVVMYVLSSGDVEATIERDIMGSWIVTVAVGVVFCTWMNRCNQRMKLLEKACVEWKKLNPVDKVEKQWRRRTLVLEKIILILPSPFTTCSLFCASAYSIPPIPSSPGHPLPWGMGWKG